MLLRALVEAEIDGVAVANQLTALKEAVDSLAKVNMELTDNIACTVGLKDKARLKITEGRMAYSAEFNLL